MGVDSGRENKVCADYYHGLAGTRGRGPVIDPQLEPPLGKLADALCVHVGEDLGGDPDGFRICRVVGCYFAAGGAGEVWYGAAVRAFAVVREGITWE